MERASAFLSGFRSPVLYVLQLASLLVVLLFVALPLDNGASVLFAFVIALLVAATAVGLWRTMTDSDGHARRGTTDDITDDPFADPGQAAKDG
ncbi:hypothetical protein [Halopiger djelfimassiliensis]|uniref:hypothetical protein n=1 Tax=Halopiger djelfimassiliensis TaxID=1293047 RepID=UPI0006779C88|nr:hypothetical protein [Halopiger djelfimassiliensis]